MSGAKFNNLVALQIGDQNKSKLITKSKYMKNKIAKIIVSFLVVMGLFFTVALIGYLIKISQVWQGVIIIISLCALTWICYDILFGKK